MRNLNIQIRLKIVYISAFNRDTIVLSRATIDYKEEIVVLYLNKFSVDARREPLITALIADTD